eukprot:8593496-Lingulodinium_polyedra.AAC.1
MDYFDWMEHAMKKKLTEEQADEKWRSLLAEAVDGEKDELGLNPDYPTRYVLSFCCCCCCCAR